MKPRLCIVDPFEHGGGAEYQISLLIDALADAGHYDIHYLTHFVDDRPRERRYRVERIGHGAIPRLGYLMEAPALYGCLSDLEPVAIYQRVAGAYTGICAAYARRHRIPLFWHVAHDTDVSPQSLDLGRNFARVHLEKWAANFGARRADQIIVQTRHQATLLQRNFARTPTAVIANFHPPATETLDKTGPLTVLWIANLKAWKRPEAFVRMAAALADCQGLRFVMVGAAVAGGNAWQDELLRTVAATPNLEYVGHKTHAEVNALLARAHVFVNTSMHEGFPNTFIQAWQRDVAVVSLDVDPDCVLAQQEVGIVAHTEAALTAAVRTLIDAPDVRAAYVERARAHALARHSLANAAELVRLIDRYSGGGERGAVRGGAGHDGAGGSVSAG